MPVIDVIIDKLEANRKILKEPPKGGGIKVSSNSEIKEIKKDKLEGLGEVVVVDFEFFTDFEPQIGSIKVGGKIVYHDKKLKTKIETKNDKIAFVPEAFQEVQNVILRAATIQAILLSKELKLPAPIQFPTVKINQTTQEQKGYA